MTPFQSSLGNLAKEHVTEGEGLGTREPVRKRWPQISIVTPSYNQGEFIDETIASVLSQAGDFYLDYIVMDGGSTDNSVEIIQKYDRLLQSGHWPIRCLGINYRWISQEDQGQSDAINKGLRLATGDILGWLNSDDIYYPDALRSVVGLDWKKNDFSYGKGMWISQDGADLCPYPTFKPNKYSLYYQCTLCQPTVFFRRSVWQDLGDFSLDYHCIFDYEYWMRGVFHGKKFHFQPRLIAKSRMYPENKSLSGQGTVEQERMRLIEKYYSREKLCKFFLSRYKKKVDNRTDERVRMLFAKMSDLETNRSYRLKTGKMPS